jgi:hypothetical protein
MGPFLEIRRGLPIPPAPPGSQGEWAPSWKSGGAFPFPRTPPGRRGNAPSWKSEGPPIPPHPPVAR